MTHDELLAEIDDNSTKCGDDCESCRIDNASWFALRAVVELHKPVLHSRYKYICEGCNLVYPCDTIDAIEKELQ